MNLLRLLNGDDLDAGLNFARSLLPMKRNGDFYHIDGKNINGNYLTATSVQESDLLYSGAIPTTGTGNCIWFRTYSATWWIVERVSCDAGGYMFCEWLATPETVNVVRTCRRYSFYFNSLTEFSLFKHQTINSSGLCWLMA